MVNFTYSPPAFLKNGLAMTLYAAFHASREWEKTVLETEPVYQEKVFIGAGGVPIYGWVAIPENAHSTLIGTYGITGDLENQWFLRLLGSKAYAQGYAVVLFDWRAHGKTAGLSPTLTSDGLYEGEDFVRIAQTAKEMGCPAPFWLTGFSLGGQLALWGVKASQDLQYSEIAGGMVICPSLDSNRSLQYLVKHPLGKWLEKAIARQLKKLAWHIHSHHPETLDPEVIERVNSIWGFDDELVIERLGFASVEEYYDASSALAILPELHKPTLIFYAEDDPLFDPSVATDLAAVCERNSALHLVLTAHGGHIGYVSSRECQRQAGDENPWWVLNRMLDWLADLNSKSVDSAFQELKK